MGRYTYVYIFVNVLRGVTLDLTVAKYLENLLTLKRISKTPLCRLSVRINNLKYLKV